MVLCSCGIIILKISMQSLIKIIIRFNMHSDQINSILSFNLKNQKMIAVAANDGVITIWNIIDSNNEIKIGKLN